MGAVIVMSNGDAYHTDDDTANRVLELTSDSEAVSVTFLDSKTKRRVTVMLSQISSVVRGE